MIKLKELMTEGNLSTQLVNNLAKLTDRNNHTVARQQLAKYIGNKKLQKAYTAIEDLNLVLGHLPQELSKLRAQLDKDLFALAKKKYSNYDDIHGAF